MLAKNIFIILQKRLLQQYNLTPYCNLNFHTHSFPLLAGHSKWANIRHIKSLKDGQKATAFTKFARQIRLAIQEGGGPDPSLNATLRSVIEEALRKNMPMATIQNNIKKSQQNKSDLKRQQVQIRYQKKVFMVCVLYTDNYAGLKMDMATIVKKAGASFVDVDHLFEDCGVIETRIECSSDLEERATDDAIECGAEEVNIIDQTSGAVNFICNAIQLPQIRRSLEGRGYNIENSEHVFIAKNVVQLSPEERNTYINFQEKLRSLPGLEDIFDNVETT